MFITQPSSRRSASDGTGGRHLIQRLMKEGNIEELRRLGGAAGVADRLRKDVEHGGGKASPPDWQQESHQSFWSFLKEACSPELVALLCHAFVGFLYFAVVDNELAPDWRNALMLLAAIFIPALCNFALSYRFHTLKQRKEVKMVLVKRGKFLSRVPDYQVRPLDIVYLGAGDQVPADGLFMEGTLMKVDESWRTQDSHEVDKSETQPFLYAGSLVAEGRGVMLVVAVGKNTRRSLRGYDAPESQVEEKSASRSQTQLEEYSIRWRRFARLMTVILFLLFTVTYLLKDYKPRGGHGLTILTRQFLTFSNLALSMLVVAVPGGLLVSLPLVERCFKSQMIASDILVAKSTACDNLAFATTICTGKAGVLTANQKRVRRAWVAGRTRDYQDLNSSQDQACRLLREGIPSADESSVCFGEEPESQVASSSIERGSIERALMEFVSKIGAPPSAGDMPVILQRKLFTSRDKYSGVVVRRRDETGRGDETIRAYCKGPAEDICKKCTYYKDDDALHSMTNRSFYQIKRIIDSMGREGLNCIGFAYRNVEGPQVHVPEHDLTLLAIFGIEDPCRLDASQAVASCRAAGVKVIMVTGDTLEAATVIAKQIGILTSTENVFEAGDLWSCSPHVLKDRLQTVEVVARMTPDHKTRLIKELQAMDGVVAVTGGGAEDASALKAAKVGMALNATQVAKASSDVLVISNDGFASAVKAVGWGRTMNATIKRLLVFQGTASIVVLVLNFLAGIGDEEVPFDGSKLMWVSLILNTFGALALSMEPLDDEVMKQHPPHRHTRPLTPAMLRDMLGVGGFQVAILLVVVNKMLTLKGSTVQQVSQKNMFMFNAFIVGLIVNLLSAATLGRPNRFFRFRKSGAFLMVISFIAICQVLMVQFGEAHSKGLDLSQWLGSVLVGVLNLPIAAAFKYFVPVDGVHQVTTVETIMEGSSDMAESVATMPLLSEV